MRRTWGCASTMWFTNQERAERWDSGV